MLTFAESDASRGWPAVKWESLPWRGDPEGHQSRRAALRARGNYDSAVPPFIARLSLPRLDDDTSALIEDAATALARFDGEVGAVTAPFSAIMLRSESAASSEIEQLTATAKNIALAELGRGGGSNSRSIVGNVRAMEAAIELGNDLSAASVIAMQAEILRDDHPELTGGWRTQPVWIGGGYSSSPHTAAFVPPRHERVGRLMDDLLSFAARIDLPAFAQIAIAHAQFETVHPFADGNGRTGRALIQAMLHRMGLTRSVTVPVSAGLLRNTAGYFEALTAYRRGDVGGIIRAMADASLAAVVNGRQLVGDLTEIRAGWDVSASARAGSAGRRLLDVLQRQPIIDAALAAGTLGVSYRNAQGGIDRLVDDGILHKIGAGDRNRLYEAREVLAVLDEFAARARRG